MNILGFDTAGSFCSVAYWADETVTAWRHEAMARGHAEALMPMILAVLEDATATFDDLDAVAVTIGPGSFTGLRVGLAAAQGLSLARNLPVIGLTTLEATAFAVHLDGGAADRERAHLLSAIETKRADIYVQIFSAAAEALSEPCAMMPEDVAAALPSGPVIVAGDAAARAFDAIAQTRRGVDATTVDTVADARCLVRLARDRTSRQGLPDRAQRPLPLYIHPPRARVPAHEGRLRP